MHPPPTFIFKDYWTKEAYNPFGPLPPPSLLSNYIASQCLSSYGS